MLYERGKIVRSSDLEQHHRQSELKSQQTLEVAEAAAFRLEELRLALIANQKDRVVRSVNELGELVTPVVPIPGNGAMLLGKTCVTERNTTKPINAYDPASASGYRSLLAPLELTVRTLETKEAYFEVLAQPAFVSLYNEVIIPAYSEDRVEYELFKDTGSVFLEAGGWTKTFRFSANQRFNGRIRAHSISSTRLPNGLYVHVFGSPALSKSEWRSTGLIKATYTVPQGIRLKNVYPEGLNTTNIRLIQLKAGSEILDLNNPATWDKSGSLTPVTFEATFEIDWSASVNYISFVTTTV